MKWSSIAVVGVLLSLSACTGMGTPQATPTARPSGALDIQLLGQGGPYSVGPPTIVAARSEPELDALLHAVAASFSRPDDWDAQANVGGRVYLALSDRFCQVIDSVNALLSAPALVTVNVTMSGQCAPGAGAAAIPTMYLAAIPAKELPGAVVTFRLAGGTGQARVDLRPGQMSLDPSAVTVGARNAVKAARLSVGSNATSSGVSELDVLEFPTSSPPCPRLAPTLPESGFVVVVDEGPPSLSHPETFVWLDNRLTDCGNPAGG